MTTIGLWLAALATPLAAGEALSDWPQFRGPAHDSTKQAEQIVSVFPPAGPPILWVRELGQGYSGFAVAAGRAYTQTQSLYEQSLSCLDVETGQTIWSYSYGWPYDGGGLYPGPRSTPTVSGGNVYFASPQGVVGCVTAKDGRPVWTVDVLKQFGGRGAEFGYSASPLVVDGLVILPVGGAAASVVALNAGDGHTVWKAGTKPASYSTPLPIEWQGQPLVVVLLQNSLACIQRQSGELWWELPLSQGYDEHATAPIYREPHLLVTGPFHSGATMYELKASGQRCQPNVVWFSEKMSNDVASSVVVAGTLFGFDLREAQSRLHRPSRGEFRALDFLSGEMRWSSKEPGHSQIIAADGKLILFNDRGEVLLTRATAEKYDELGRVTVFPGEVCWTAPALADGRLLLRSPTRVACVYLGPEPLSSPMKPLAASELAGRRRFDPTVLVGGEREYPATLPQASEFARWFGWCLGAMILAGMVAGGCRFLGAGRWSDLLFWTLVLLAGSSGGALLNRLQSEYVFTWPLLLWAGFQLTIGRSWSMRHAPLWSWQRGSSYLVGLSFFVLCGLYFHLCRWLGLAIEWGFLTGFIGALPAAVIAAWLAASEPRRWPRELAALLASFAGFYWSAVAFLWWRLA